MIDLVLNNRKHGMVSLQQVAQRQSISEKYLWQIANRLKAADLISAVSGAKGGYRLARAPQEITLAEILYALEGKFHLVPCVSKPSFCLQSSSCLSRKVWKTLNSKITDALEAMTLNDIIQDQSKIMENSPLTYTI